MVTLSISTLGFIYAPIIIIFPCYPPMITSHLYDCEAPGPSTIRDYAQIIIFGGINVLIAWQTILDAIVHADFITFLGFVMLMEYILVIERLFFPFVYITNNNI